jgi:translocation and assembly module TamB
MIRWSVLGLAILLLVTITGGILFLRTPSFKRLAIRTIVSRANRATGGHAAIGRIDFTLSPLTVRLYNITLRGAEPATQPPLLQADRLTVGLEIQSLIKSRITLSQLDIQHPVVRVRVDREGISNLPLTPANSSASPTTVFDLAAQHVSLNGGLVQHNDQTIPLDVELHGLAAEIRFEPTETRYLGSISYDNGSFRYGANRILPHHFDAEFSATPSQFSLDSAALKFGSSILSASAKLTNYQSPSVEGRYDLQIQVQDFAALLPSLKPVGGVALSGTLHYQAKKGKAFLRGLSLDGEVRSAEISISSRQALVAIHALQGEYRLAHGAFQANHLTCETLGGNLTTEISLEHLDSAPLGNIRSTLQGISLSAAQHSIRDADVRRVNLSGKLDGTIGASWRGGPDSLLVRSDLIIQPALPASNTPSTTLLSITGAIHASYDGPHDIIAFRNTALRLPSTTLSVQGELSRHSNLQMQMNAADLQQLAGTMAALGIKRADSLLVAGSASLKAVVQGTTQQPEVNGQFNARDLRIQGSDWRSAHATFQASPSRLMVQNATLVSAHQGQGSLIANLALKNWSYLPSSPVSGTLTIQKLSIADLQILANQHYPISGDLTADVHLQGSLQSPVGSGSIEVGEGKAYGEPVQHLTAAFTADKSSLRSTLNATLPAGAANASLSYFPATRAYSFRLNAPAVLLQKLQTVQGKNLGIVGTVALSASGEGTLHHPQLDASIQIPQLHLRDKFMCPVEARLHLADERGELTLDSRIAQAALHAHASVSTGGDLYTEATIDTTALPLDTLLAIYLPNQPSGFQGGAELHATMKGPLKDKSRIEAHLTLATLKASYQSLAIAAATPVRADLVDSVITLQPTEIKGTGTSIQFQGSVPLSGPQSSTLVAQGSIDARIVKIIEPQMQSSGTVSLDVHAFGTASHPAVQGQVRFQDVALSTPTAPLSLQKLNGTLHIVDNSVQLTGLTGEMGGGTFSAGGSISYRPNLQFNVTLESKSVRLRYPEGVRALLDGELVLSGTADAATLNGRVLIDTLSFTPDFDLAKFSDQFGGTSVPAPPGILDNLKLAIGVQSKSDLSATSSQVSIAGDVNLQVVGTATNPVVVGRTDLTSGELFYRNVRYQLQRGIITFDNATQTEPILNLSATTTIEQYNLTITLRGPFDKLTTSYTADPPLATADVISLIASGQTTSEASAAGTSTDSILASQAASHITGGIQHLAGISSLQIDPLLGGNNQNPSARVAIQQRVTRNLLFTFSTDLSQPGTEIVQGDYQINKRWSVGVTRDEVGGVTLDGKYHTKF